MSDASNRRTFLKTALATGGAVALSGARGAQAEPLASGKGKKALFVYGGWPGHQPVEMRDVFVPWLQEQGFEVVASDSQEPYGDAELMGSLDVVIQNWTMGQIARPHLQGLLGAVKSGVGLAGWHGGIGDAYRQETDFQYMVGGCWVAHPGNIIPYRVNITDSDDPITAGLSDFEVKTEQYLMHVNPNNRVLATTSFTGAHDPWIDGSTMPVVWKKMYGKGRVFYNSLGHSVDVWETPEALTIMQRGILWAAQSRHEETAHLISPVYPKG